MTLHTLPHTVLLSGGDTLANGRTLPVLYEVDLSQRRSRKVFSLQAATAPLSGFQGLCRDGDRLILVTLWELLVLDARDFTTLLRLAHPRFNQLHHALPYKNGYALANTKCDEILFLDASGTIESSIHLTLDADGRVTASARAAPAPANDLCHPNFLFSLADGSLYATLLRADCAVNVHDTEQQFLMQGLGHPHAGLLSQQQIYFVTTDGHISINEPGFAMPVAHLDMAKNYGERVKVGIPKGILIAGDLAIVAFDRHAPKNGPPSPSDWEILPSRVAIFELSSGCLLDEIIIADGSGQLFSVIDR